MNTILLDEYLPCVWMWCRCPQNMSEDRRWLGRSVAGVHNAAAGTAAWGLPRASPQLDHTRINAGKADQQFFVHFLQINSFCMDPFS